MRLSFWFATSNWIFDHHFYVCPSDCGVGVEGAIALVSNLRKNTTVTSLELSGETPMLPSFAWLTSERCILWNLSTDEGPPVVMTFSEFSSIRIKRRKRACSLICTSPCEIVHFRRKLPRPVQRNSWILLSTINRHDLLKDAHNILTCHLHIGFPEYIWVDHRHAHYPSDIFFLFLFLTGNGLGPRGCKEISSVLRTIASKEKFGFKGETRSQARSSHYANVIVISRRI